MLTSHSLLPFLNYLTNIKYRNETKKILRQKIKVNIKENAWGRYLVRVTDLDGGHSTSTIAFFDWANWMERDGGSDNKIISSRCCKSFRPFEKNKKNSLSSKAV
jgi:hypothetical protein